MARALVKWGDEVLRLSSDMPKSPERERGSDLVLVPGGPRFAYLWTFHATYGGEVALRALAKAILKEIGPPRARPRRKEKRRDSK